MSRPSHHDIAAALGVESYRVSQLVKRGMPISCMRKARQWFELHGMRYVDKTPHAVRKQKTAGPPEGVTHRGSIAA